MSRYLLFVPFILLASCGGEKTGQPEKKGSEEKKDTSHTTAEIVTGFHNGDNCFEYYGVSGQRYLSFDKAGDEISGTLYENDEYHGDYFVEFDGIIEGENILATIHYFPEDVESVWKIRIRADGEISLFGLPSNPGTIEITPIDCEDLPDIKTYSTAQEIAQKKEAEYAEYGESGSHCFYKYYSTPGGRITVAEYLMLHFDEDSEDEKIYGSATGYLEGEGEWKMNFTGKRTNDTIYEIEASYEHSLNNISKFNTRETWFIDPEINRVTIHKISANKFRQVGTIPFHRIDCMDMDTWAKRILNGW